MVSEREKNLIEDLKEMINVKFSKWEKIIIIGFAFLILFFFLIIIVENIMY